MPKLQKVVLMEAFTAVTSTWNPHIGGDINDFQIKLVKLEGEFHWHHHETEDELFLVVRGTLRMKLHEQDGGDIVLQAGDYLIVPHGVEHCPIAEPTCDVVLLERNTTINTGTTETERTRRNLVRL